jgi:nitronate monooxygenase
MGITCRVFCTAFSTDGTPHIIQGGMGIRISKWELARTVAQKGELGVVSGTVIDTMMIRELQDGDPEGSMRRALATFPDQDMVQRVLDKYYIENGKNRMKPYKNLEMWTVKPSQHLLEVCILANYCEVWLAKHEDDGALVLDGKGKVGLNLLTKVQLPTVPSLYGAMLANVDYVLMGAGIPMMIPGILDSLAECGDCEQSISTVSGSDDDKSLVMKFSPKQFWEAAGKPHLATVLQRPKFVPIVSSVVLAQSMLKRASGKGPTRGINGFVVELPTAGGHNAPPRGFRYDAVAKSHAVDLNDRGEPVYGTKDTVDLAKFAQAVKGLPFWLAGSYADPHKLCAVINVGGAGVQVGTAFSLAKESGLEPKTKQEICNHLAISSDDDKLPLEVFTDPVASPTGFPFKVLKWTNTLSDVKNYAERPRACTLGYLRDIYTKPDGSVGYRCASEPVDTYMKKGGELEATQGRKCLCNALCANVGSPQVQPKNEYVEGMLITIGDDVNNCKRYLKKETDGTTENWSYSASDVVDYLRSELASSSTL